MNRTRLHVDGLGAGWALVRCEVCADINKYPALGAFNAPISCKVCGTVMDLRDLLMAEVAKSHNAPDELIGAISDVGTRHLAAA
jgi:hypothetical protein